MKANRGNPNMRIRTALIVSVSTLAIVTYGALNYSGFCFSQWRYLSDEEKIRLAIAQLSSVDPSRNLERAKVSGIPYDGKHNYYEQLLRSYDNVDEFLQKNPNCCALVPKQEPFTEDFNYPTFWDKITGAYSYGVRIRYTWRYLITPIDENGNEGTPYVKDTKGAGHHEYGNCGCRWKDTHD